MEFVIAGFMLNPDHQQDEDGQAKPQPEDVDERIRKVFSQSSKTDQQVVFYHETRRLSEISYRTHLLTLGLHIFLIIYRQ